MLIFRLLWTLMRLWRMKEMLLKNVKDLKVKLNEPQANITSDVVVSAKVQEELVKQARNQNMN